jgi:hypothetical protein
LRRTILNGLNRVEAEYFGEVLEEAGIDAVIEESGLTGPFGKDFVIGSNDTMTGGFRLSVAENDGNEAMALLEPLLRKNGERT